VTKAEAVMPGSPLPWENSPWTARCKGDGSVVADCIVDANHHLMLETKQANLAYLVHAANAYPRLIEALLAIAKGEGRFSLDHLEHASNTIEDMQDLARTALRDLGELEEQCPAHEDLTDEETENLVRTGELLGSALEPRKRSRRTMKKAKVNDEEQIDRLRTALVKIKKIIDDALGPPKPRGICEPESTKGEGEE
jgi:hypothetical protein